MRGTIQPPALVLPFKLEGANRGRAEWSAQFDGSTCSSDVLHSRHSGVTRVARAFKNALSFAATLFGLSTSSPTAKTGARPVGGAVPWRRRLEYEMRHGDAVLSVHASANARDIRKEKASRYMLYYYRGLPATQFEQLISVDHDDKNTFPEGEGVSGSPFTCLVFGSENSSPPRWDEQAEALSLKIGLGYYTLLDLGHTERENVLNFKFRLYLHTWTQTDFMVDVTYEPLEEKRVTYPETVRIPEILHSTTFRLANRHFRL
ncbi:hypothetical protein BU15DRAFT_59463 [Melanogaster broomeanus]|nr:hypothetical protein BU15DRAFT_59463 [Melanogaster broomeanus]